MNMREKRSVKKTTVNCSKSSITGENTSVVNGVYKRENSANCFIESRCVSNNKLDERWNAMDYEKYFMYRKNGSVNENDLMLAPTRPSPSLENFSSSTSDSSFQREEDSDSRPGHVFKFYKRVAPDYWNVFPKTDYTYSPSSSLYKKEIVPGVPVVPNLSRKLYRSIGTESSSTINLPKNTQDTKETKCIFGGNSSISSNEHPVVRRRNARVYTQKYWSSRNSWIRRTYETIKTIIITTITTSVTITTETVMHLMRKPYITFPLLSILFTILFYILFFNETEMEIRVTKTVPWMPFAWRETDPINMLATLAEPFIWIYKVVGSCIQSLITCLCMIPTLLSQVAQSINTFLIFFQRITKWTYQDPSIGALNGGNEHLQQIEKSSILDSDEIRRIVLEVLSEREQKASEEVKELKRSEKEIDSLNEFVMMVNEKLSSLESLSNDQKKALDELYPQLKSLEEKLSVTNNLNSEQSAELADRQGISNISSILGWPEVSDKVAHIVKNMLKQYHADRTGMPDYALMSNGGTIVSIRCTQTYTRDSGKIHLFGFPLWNVHSNPDVIIKPGIMPGECWAFEGSEGYVVIGLALPIYVNGFTMEHTPKELTPYGNIKSAPHQFSVWALNDIKDENPQFLGRFKFLDNGESLQYFEAVKLDVPVQIVEIKIESNHGSINYTCLYRFRIHGIPA